MDEHDGQGEPEHGADHEPAECLAEREDRGIDQHEPERRAVPLRRLGERCGDIPDVRHVQVARDLPAERRGPGIGLLSAEQLHILDGVPEYSSRTRPMRFDREHNHVRFSDHELLEFGR